MSRRASAIDQTTVRGDGCTEMVPESRDRWRGEALARDAFDYMNNARREPKKTTFLPSELLVAHHACASYGAPSPNVNGVHRP